MSAEKHRRLLFNFFVLKKKEPESDIENKLFRLITLPNGTTKNTSAKRLDEVNLFVLPFLSEIPFPVIKDVAVSSGISTMEWFQQLNKNKLSPVVNATDLYVNAFLVVKSFSLAILCDRNFNPILLETGNTLHRTSFPKGSLRFFWGKLISKAIRQLWIRKNIRENTGQINAGQNGVHEVQLLSASFEQSTSLTFTEEDILSPPKKNEIKKYDVIRAANILNKVYFSKANLNLILSNLALQLKPGGMLVICKTDDYGINHASLFEKEEYRFNILKKLNGGSEIENLVSELVFPA